MDTDKIQQDELYHIRNEIVDWVLLACCALGIVAQIFAILRILNVGFGYVIIFSTFILGYRNTSILILFRMKDHASFSVCLEKQLSWVLQKELSLWIKFHP